MPMMNYYIYGSKLNCAFSQYMRLLKQFKVSYLIFLTIIIYVYCLDLQFQLVFSSIFGHSTDLKRV